LHRSCTVSRLETASAFVVDPSGLFGTEQQAEAKKDQPIIEDKKGTVADGPNRKITLPDGTKATLNVRTGVTIKGAPFTNAIAISVNDVPAAVAQKLDFIQFIWVEVDVYKGNALSYRMNGVMETTRGPVPLTTDTTSPQWRLDTNANAAKKEANNVYYSRTFASARRVNRDKESLTVYDEPGSPNIDLGKENKDNAVTKLVYVAHFVTQVYYENKPVGGTQTYWNITYTASRFKGGVFIWNKTNAAVYDVYAHRHTQLPKGKANPNIVFVGDENGMKVLEAARQAWINDSEKNK
jgi:hypothetical protein